MTKDVINNSFELFILIFWNSHCFHSLSHIGGISFIIAETIFQYMSSLNLMRHSIILRILIITLSTLNCQKGTNFYQSVYHNGEIFVIGSNTCLALSWGINCLENCISLLSCISCTPEYTKALYRVNVHLFFATHRQTYQKIVKWCTFFKHSFKSVRREFIFHILHCYLIFAHLLHLENPGWHMLSIERELLFIFLKGVFYIGVVYCWKINLTLEDFDGNRCFLTFTTHYFYFTDFRINFGIL